MSTTTNTTEPRNSLGLLDVPANVNDPPPPYPSPERRSRPLRPSRRHAQRTRTTLPFLDSDALPEHTLHPHFSPSETTPLLRPSPRRHRTNSHASTVVSSNSLTQTVLSFCQDSDSEVNTTNYDAQLDGDAGRWALRKRAWAKYFRPMGRKVYYAAVFHLMVINFPFALIAWVYLFVFTLTGTTLLITLPLGALLCFLDLLGARIFARGELALQSKFHAPLAYPPPYPPRPLFRRLRPPELSAAEIGAVGVQYETSFYKNTYAMFTDATTYQALFYFLIIKPGITVCLSILLILLVPVSYALILPAPLMLRFVRKLGVWQANVAVEGLYYQVT